MIVTVMQDLTKGHRGGGHVKSSFFLLRLGDPGILLFHLSDFLPFPGAERNTRIIITEGRESSIKTRQTHFSISSIVSGIFLSLVSGRKKVRPPEVMAMAAKMMVGMAG